MTAKRTKGSVRPPALGALAAVVILVCAAAPPAAAIGFSPFGPEGRGGTLYGQTFTIGAGGSVFQLDGFLSLPGLDLNGDAPGTSAQLGADPLPAGLGFSFTPTLSADGTDLTLAYSLTNGTGTVLTGARFFVFLDAEIDEPLNTFFNEFATVTGTAAPGQSFEIDEPGFVFGDILTNILAGVLDGTNGVAAGSPDDVSMALGFDLSLDPLAQATIRILLSEDQSLLGTLALTQFDTDPGSPTAITLSGGATSAVPLPATLVLVGTGVAVGAAARRLARRGRAIARSLALAALVVLAGWNAGPARAQDPTPAVIDLTDPEKWGSRTVVLQSQTDPRWAAVPVGYNRDVPMGRCGCLLAVLATVLNQELRGVLPWYPVKPPRGATGLDFNPVYLEAYLHIGPSPEDFRPPRWGYKPLPAGTCGVLPWPFALSNVAQFDGVPTGVNLFFEPGFGADIRRIVDDKLRAGRPTIVVRGTRAGEEGGPGYHAQLIVGWEHDDEGRRYYLALDPRQQTGSRGIRPFTSLEGTYEAWEENIVGIIDVQLRGLGVLDWLFFGDDPSPIAILAIDPEGRRTGFDRTLGSHTGQHPSASYWPLEGWVDAFGALPPGDPARFVAIESPAAGTYRFEVVGTADGPFAVSASTFAADVETGLGTFTGLIARDQVRKFELRFSRSAPSTVAEVQSFTPEARAGQDVSGVTGAPIAFDGRNSRDDDGPIVAYSWDFGDGTTATGAQVAHAYAAPGSYTVTLTVTDAAGATASDILQASVILAQARPVAHVSGPYLGFASPPGIFNPFFVEFRAVGSSDPNGDALGARWDFGDGSPVEVTPPGQLLIARHTYQAPGRYDVTLIVGDGIEDSDPVTTTVEILPWRGAANGRESVSVTPGCGPAGSAISLRVDGLSVIDPRGGWNFADGPLPPVPDRISLGIPGTPDGHVQVRVHPPEGAEQEGAGAFVPWVASMVSRAEFGLSLEWMLPPEVQAAGRHVVEVGEEIRASFDLPCPVPANQPPLAHAGGPYSGVVGTPVSFSGLLSTDADGDVLTYVWHFGDGATGTGVAPQHVYAEEGTYYVTLVVNDGTRDSFATVGLHEAAIVTIGPAPPAPTITDLAARPKDGKIDLTWTCPAGAARYNVYRSTTPGGPHALIRAGHTSTYCAYADLGLANGTRYYYQVRSVDAAGLESLPSNEASATPTALRVRP